MRLVILESPYGSPDPSIVARNVRYARACMLDCFDRGEAPFASHLLYTQPSVLDDRVPEERAKGIAAGLLWGEKSDATVVYIDLGRTHGMEEGIIRAHGNLRPVELRKLCQATLQQLMIIV